VTGPGDQFSESVRRGLANLRIGVKSGSDWHVSLFCGNPANPDFNRLIAGLPRTIGLDFSTKR
jgi:hypothetical protein